MAVTVPAVSAFEPIPTGPAAQTTAAQIGEVSTTQDQLVGILNKGGPLMQQAATFGNQQAASRGLLNSSMGVQAAQAATLQQAVPIASADANATNQINQTNAAATNQIGQNNTAAQNTMIQTNTQNANAAAQWNAGQKNAAVTQAMDLNSRETLANIEADYKQVMQTSSSAGTLYEQTMKNISDIQGNVNISDKLTAVNSQMAWLKSGLQMYQNMSGISNLVTF